MTDRRTDGQICKNNIALCMHSMLTRDKNVPEAVSFGIGAWLTVRNMQLPHACWVAKYGHSRSNHMGVSRFNSEIHNVHACYHVTYRW